MPRHINLCHTANPICLDCGGFFSCLTESFSNASKNILFNQGVTPPPPILASYFAAPTYGRGHFAEILPPSGEQGFFVCFDHMKEYHHEQV
jgi:hypothetical protein